MNRLCLPYIAVKLLADEMKLEARPYSPAFDLMNLMEQITAHASPELMNGIRQDIITHGYLLTGKKKNTVSSDMEKLLRALYEPAYCYLIETKGETEGRVEGTQVYYVPVDGALLKVIPHMGSFHIEGPVCMQQLRTEVGLMITLGAKKENESILFSMRNANQVLSTTIHTEETYILLGSRMTAEGEYILSGSIPKADANIANLIRIAFGEEKYPSEYEPNKKPPLQIEVKPKKRGFMVLRGILITLAVNVCVTIFNIVLRMFLV